MYESTRVQGLSIAGTATFQQELLVSPYQETRGWGGY